MYSKIKKTLLNSFNGEDDSFIIWTAFKVVAIAVLILVIIYLMMYNLMRINSYYFISLGFSNSDELLAIYYEYITKNLSSLFPIIFAFFICSFLGGIYIAKSLLRPFEAIAAYSEAAIDNVEAVYQNNYFSSQRLLASFSEYFFSYIRISRNEGVLRNNVIPPQYTKIHKPVFDKVFFFHFTLIIGILCFATSWFIQSVSSDLYINMTDFALKVISKKKTADFATFLINQRDIIDFYIGIAIFLTSLLYIILGFHLYSKVSGAAFGFFATMRSFMKGNYLARVHLIGYNYIRPQSRKFNKFLDTIQKNFETKNG